MRQQLSDFKAEFFKALAHPLRISILDALREGELTVNEIRKKYWDKNKKIGKPISYFAVQTYGDVFTMNHANEHPPFFSQPDIFIPDGTLHHYNMKTKKRKSGMIG